MVALYFAWKAAAAQALLLDANGIGPDSVSGRALGARYQQSLTDAVGDDPHGLVDLALAGEADHASWPAPDRDLHIATEEYLHRCQG